MKIYLDLAVLLNFLVDGALLLGVKRMAGDPPDFLRCALAAGLGSAYGTVCLIPCLKFWGTVSGQAAVLAFMGLTAFGPGIKGFRRTVLFSFLSLALGGISVLIQRHTFLAVVLSACLVLFLCSFGFRRGSPQQKTVSVSISCGDQKVVLTALEDTGNMLRDPLSGQPVLIAGPDTAVQLLNLSREELQHPAETVLEGTHPGLRLLPYHTLGMSAGMLAAYRFPDVQIDGKRKNTLVAFAPEKLTGEYQALTGGTL